MSKPRQQDARSLLKHYSSTLAQLEAKQTLYESLLSMYTSCTSKMSDGNLPATRDFSRKYDAIAEADLMLKRLQSEISDYTNACVVLNRIIGKISNPQHIRIIHYRYICRYAWWRIAQEMSISVRQVHRIHTQALDALQAQINTLAKTDQ